MTHCYLLQAPISTLGGVALSELAVRLPSQPQS